MKEKGERGRKHEESSSFSAHFRCYQLDLRPHVKLRTYLQYVRTYTALQAALVFIFKASTGREKELENIGVGLFYVVDEKPSVYYTRTP